MSRAQKLAWSLRIMWFSTPFALFAYPDWNNMNHHLAEVLASIIVAGVAAQWLGWRLRIPALILLIGFGFLLGPVTGWLEPSADFGSLLQPMISLSVAVILFEGGLNLHWHELRKHSNIITRLVTWNVLLTFAMGSLASHYLVGLAWPVALMFGAIIIVTGPTVIMPLLKQANLRQRPAALLRWEGIVNDPIGALLVVLIYGYYTYADADMLATQILYGLGISLLSALILGVGGGFLLARAFRSGQVPEYLKFPITLLMVLAVYVIANRVQGEAGLLATTLLGITLANQPLNSLHEMRRFKEYVTLLLVSATFIVLTADIDPEILHRLGWQSWLLLILVIFLVRPLSIYLSTLFCDIDQRERLLLGWIAPRGIVAAAVAGLFGAQLIEKGYEGAELLLPLVFALIVATVVLHGLSIAWLGRRLDLAAPPRDGVLLVGCAPWSIALAAELDRASIPVLLVDSQWNALRAARMQGLPVHYGELLSERTDEVLELAHITRLLAVTPNEAYNTLVCTRFGPELGHHNVYELGWAAISDDESRLPASSLLGTVLFDDELTHAELSQRIDDGWTFQTTPLSGEFRLADAHAIQPSGSLPIAALDGKGGIHFYPWRERLDDADIRAVIMLVPPDADRAP